MFIQEKDVAPGCFPHTWSSIRRRRIKCDSGGRSLLQGRTSSREVMAREAGELATIGGERGLMAATSAEADGEGVDVAVLLGIW